jgi:hypothetical protein
MGLGARTRDGKLPRDADVVVRRTYLLPWLSPVEIEMFL